MTNKPTSAEQQAKFNQCVDDLAILAWPTPEAYQKWCDDLGIEVSKVVQERVIRIIQETKLKYELTKN